MPTGPVGFVASIGALNALPMRLCEVRGGGKGIGVHVGRAQSMRGALAVLSALFLAGSAHAAYCHGAPEPNAPANTLPLVTSAPVLVNETANGKLFVAGPADQPFYIVHVYGDAQQVRG